MKEQYRKFGKKLRALLPDGRGNIEITVPNRLTRLFLVNYGSNNEGGTLITLTDTLLRLEHLSAMRLHDVQFLGEVHRNDRPTFITTAFSCSWEDAGMVAEPISFVDHGRGTFGEIFTHDEDGRRSGMNIPLLQRIIADSTRNFERFHSMGFFGPKAVSKPRQNLEIDWQRINAGIAVDRLMSLEMLEIYIDNYRRRMAFLEECARKSGEQ